MSAAGQVAYLVIGAAFVAFFVMASIAYDQIRAKAWQALLMCVTVLLLLLMIMKRATDIATHEQERGAVTEDSSAAR